MKYKNKTSSKRLYSKNIILFFSYGVSLSVWEKLGIIDRELDIAKRLKQNLKSLNFITYDVDKDVKYTDLLDGIKILSNKYRLPKLLYSFLIPLLHFKVLSKSDIYKVNQLSGSLPAIISKLIYRKKLIVRCGFQLSLFFSLQKEKQIKIWMAKILEIFAYNMADLIIVTTENDKSYIIKSYKIKKDKIVVIPNGINTEVFRKDHTIKKERGRIIFVGRLIKQKNLFSLIEALRDIDDVSLCIIGQGYLKPSLCKLIDKYNLRVEIKDFVNNYSLPKELNRSEIFILPSYFEGNPKVLLEAMACSLPVISADVTGNRSIIKHRENGILCGVSAGEIKSAIVDLLKNRKLMEITGKKAREHVIINFDLKKSIEKELIYLDSIFCSNLK